MTYLHHILIHFPIAFSSGALMFALINVAKKGTFWKKITLIILVAGGLFAIPTAITGLISADHWPDNQIEYHKISAIISSILYILAGLWSLIMLLKNRYVAPVTLLIVSLTISGAIGITGQLGGIMVHPDISLISTSEHSHGQEHSDNHSTQKDNSHNDGHDHEH